MGQKARRGNGRGQPGHEVVCLNFEIHDYLMAAQETPMITEAVDLNADDDAVQHIAVACLSSDDLALDTCAIFREHEGAGFSFQGVADTIGTNSIPNVQRYLMNTYPGQLILELPGALQDCGVTSVQLTIPSSMSRTVGTTDSL